jgi:hypothetical protein
MSHLISRRSVVSFSAPSLPSLPAQVPLEWYAEHEHIGYRIDGTKLVRKTPQDELDRFLASIDDPNSRRTIYDAINDKQVRPQSPQSPPNLHHRISNNQLFPDFCSRFLSCDKF